MNLLLAALALAFAEGPTAPPTDARVYVLDNGLRLIVEQQTRTDDTALFLHFAVGSRDEGPGEHGCAHLFEHLMFEGSQHVPQNAFDDLLTAAGGDNNAWTNVDETVYTMRFPSGALDLALFLESDRLGFLDAGLTSDNLANQQDVVLQERAQGFDAPYGRDYDALMGLLHPPGHPYHVSTIGTVADVRGFTLDAVRRFWRAHYRTRNATLVIVGPLPPDDVAARVDHWFGDVVDTGPPAPRPTAPPPDPTAPRAGHLSDRVEDRTLYAAWPTVPVDHPDTHALELLSYVLDDGPGTRLDARHGRPASPITDSGAWTTHDQLAGHFALTVSSQRKPLRALAREVDRVLADFDRRPPTDAELSRARVAVKADMLSGIDDPATRGVLFLRCYALHGDPNCLDRELARYDTITAADLDRVRTTWLRPDTRVLLGVAPTADLDRLPGAVDMELP